jgi:hypothetical protein
MKYTLAEIDALRDAAREWYGLHSNFQTQELEERVRTFMTNGTMAAEVKASIRTRRARVFGLGTSMETKDAR